MRKLIHGGLLLSIALLLTGCAENKAKLTITPYTLSEKELELMSKTDVDQIDFFHLNGSLAKDQDLRFSVEVYKNGELAGELLSTQSEVKTEFDDTLLSFAIERFEEDEQRFLKLIAGIPSGKVTTNYDNTMKATTSTSLIKEKVQLELGKPVYLSAWAGTTKNEFEVIGSWNGGFPKGMEDKELAFLYKMVWTMDEKD